MKKVGVQAVPVSAVGEDREAIASPKITQSSSNEKSGNGCNIPYKMFSAGELLSWLMLFSFF